MKRSLSLLLIAVCAGCTDAPPRVEVIPTRGKITLENQPAAGALLIFHPTGELGTLPAKPRAQVGADGSFVVDTYASGDGMPAGEYIVTVEWRHRGASEGEEGPSLAPIAYLQLERSPLRIYVSPGANGVCELPTLRMRR